MSKRRASDDESDEGYVKRPRVTHPKRVTVYVPSDESEDVEESPPLVIEPTPSPATPPWTDEALAELQQAQVRPQVQKRLLFLCYS